MRINFVTTQEVKNNSVVEQNVDNKIIMSTIEDVERIEIQQVLGADFYEHLYKAIDNNTLTSDEMYLIDEYIKPTVFKYVVYQMSLNNLIQIRNVGNVKGSSEYSESAFLNEIKYFRGEVLDMAQFYKKRLVTYLCDNKSLFPIYQNTDGGNVKKSGKSFHSGIYLSNKKGCKGC